MKIITHFLTIFLVGFLFTANSFGQGDQPQGAGFQFDVPQNIQSIQQQIKLAEDNEDWDLYYSLRPQLIAAWQEVKPEIASKYRTTNSLESDLNSTEAPKQGEPIEQVNTPFWGNDLIVHTGDVDDISLVVTRSDTLYLATLASGGSSVNIYVSGDGGSNWSFFKQNFSNSATKIELLDFDGQQGSTGPAYLLLFSQYSSGTLWCTRFETGTGTYVNSMVVESGVTDFAVDRNFPISNYRCFVIYDSAATQYTKRSDPASYATIWQDPYQIYSCKNPDLAYGFNGTLYYIYIGRNTGNLYQINNYNYGDPTSFVGQRTIESGATDTTFTPEIIASRQDTSTQTVIAVYTALNNGQNFLKSTIKTGGAGWNTSSSWSSFPDTDNKLVNLFSRKASSNSIFQASFTRTGLGSSSPRAIRYRKYNTGWNSSTQRSDSSISVTGLQESNVIEFNNGLAALAYVGSSGINVYFDNEEWVTDVTPENSFPESYSLSQNYPNPFNPSTTIKFSVPEQTSVKLTLYNAIGQQIATLINSELAAGIHSVDFNASNLSSGVYFYRIDSPSFTSTKKMILIK